MIHSLCIFVCVFFCVFLWFFFFFFVLVWASSLFTIKLSWVELIPLASSSSSSFSTEAENIWASRSSISVLCWSCCSWDNRLCIQHIPSEHTALSPSFIPTSSLSTTTRVFNQVINNLVVKIKRSKQQCMNVCKKCSSDKTGYKRSDWFFTQQFLQQQWIRCTTYKL